MIPYDRFNSFLLLRYCQDLKDYFDDSKFTVRYSDYVKSQLDFNIISEKGRCIGDYIKAYKKDLNSIIKVCGFFMNDVGEILVSLPVETDDTSFKFSFEIDTNKLERIPVRYFSECCKGKINVFSEEILDIILDNIKAFLNNDTMSLNVDDFTSTLGKIGKDFINRPSKSLALGFFMLYMRRLGMLGVVEVKE